ncbi:gliding motility lipoprotein GldD [Flavobacteriaceae bacterium]|nr:gliding motility lipoprotein GldD [Flavobacteriaceae bacterium]
MRGFYSGLGLFVAFIITSCNSTPTYPKPKAFLALSYQKANYRLFENEYYTLPVPKWAQVLNKTSKSIELFYPELNASLYINYVPVTLSLDEMVHGIEKKLSEHQTKATAIVAYPYEEDGGTKAGVLYEIKGNAASSAQFYVTDKEKHFLNGALYFNIKPNYDSIYPAAQYIIEDLREMISQVSWKTP